MPTSILLHPDLGVCLEFEDQHGATIALHSLARLWKSSEDAQIVPQAAALLGWGEEQVRGVFESLLKQAAENTDEPE